MPVNELVREEYPDCAQPENWLHSADAWTASIEETLKDLPTEHAERDCFESDADLESLRRTLHRLVSNRRRTPVRRHTTLVGMIYEFRGSDAIVDFDTAAGHERRVMNASELRSAGVVIEGQPFELQVIEYRLSTSHRWETRLRALVPAMAYRNGQRVPVGGFAKFRRLG